LNALGKELASHARTASGIENAARANDDGERLIVEAQRGRGFTGESGIVPLACAFDAKASSCGKPSDRFERTGASIVVRRLRSRSAHDARLGKRTLHDVDPLA
jgi:hypothetical protein